MSQKVLILGALAFLFFANTGEARTWYVAANGSGDAPTIAAAVDSSVSGDVILVGPGVHLVSDSAGGEINMKPGTSLLSEVGPALTHLEAGSPPQPGLISTRNNCRVSGFTMTGNLAATLYVGGDHVEISNNVIKGGISGTSAVVVGGRFASIHHNVCLGGNSGVYLGVSFEGADIYNNIILNGIDHTDPCPTVLIHCNLINGSAGACIVYDNFSADPMFCGMDNYYIQNNSPCAPGNQPDGIDCGLIGPLPIGCGPVRTEPRTWGSIKAMYRDE